MRAVAAGVLGAAMIAVASPAWASPNDITVLPTATPTTTASPTVGTQATPTSTPTPAGIAGETTPTPTPTASPTATEAPLIGGETTSASPTASPTPGVISIPGIGDLNLNLAKDCADFNSWSPIKVPCDHQINGIEDFEANPLMLVATCGPTGPNWKITNTGAKAVGFGWFDINLGGGISALAPGQTQTLNSHSIAVIAAPWDAATSTLLVAIPAVGFSTCPGAPALPAAPAALRVAVPAAAVPGQPYYTG
jgi:hypothetical protein